MAAKYNGNNVDTVLAKFKSLKDFIKRLDAGDVTKENMKAEVEVQILNCEDMTRRVSILGLFSVNEELSEVQTGHIPFMLLPVFLGYLHDSIPNPPDRIDKLYLTKAYYMDYLERLTSYGILDDSLGLGHVMQQNQTNENENIHVPTNNSGNVVDQTKLREQKMLRYRNRKELETTLNALEKVDVKGVECDDEDLRKWHTIECKLWAVKCTDALDGLNRELDMLKRFGEMSHNDKSDASTSTQSSQPTPKPVRPFIITKNQLQKTVYGAGYPSLPVLTVEEWAKQKYEKEMSGEKVVEKKKGEPEDKYDEGNEEAMQARVRDEYKDTHRKGWGNTHNKG